MNSSEQFKKYTEKVCDQIRWKNAHNMVKKEIENHLIDQKIAYMNMGDSESIAEEKALLQMGDPVEIGSALDHTHKPIPQKSMIALVMLLVIVGMIIQYWLTVTCVNLDINSGSIPYQFVMYGVGVFVLFAAYFLDFSFFSKHPYILFLSIIIIDILAQLFGTWYGGNRWLHLGPFSLSPSSVSLLFPLAFCSIYYQLRGKGTQGYLISGIFAVCCCAFLLTFHTMGGVVIFLCSAGILMLIAAFKNWFGEKTKPLLLLFIIAFIICTCCLLLTPQVMYRLSHITAILHPEIDPAGAGYLSGILQNMIKNSVFWGEGTPFLNYDVTYAVMLSNFRSDFLLTFLTYKYGWGASITLILLLSMFIGIGFNKCLKQKSILGKTMSLSILCTFTVEILLYVISNLGYPIIAPIGLPFLSYGGTTLVIHMALTGILLSTFRTGEVYQDKVKSVLNDETKFVQWDNGKLIITFKSL